MKVMSQQVEVVDPTLKAAMQQYPTHVVNGVEEVVSYRDPKTGKLIDQPKPSMLVPIPHAEPSFVSPAPAQPNLLEPGASETPGMGRLRSVGQ